MRLYSRAFVKALRREGRFPRRPFTLRAANGESRWGLLRVLLPLWLLGYGLVVKPYPLLLLVIWGTCSIFLRAMQLARTDIRPLLTLPVADHAYFRFRFEKMLRTSLWFFADAVAILAVQEPGLGTAIACAAVAWATVVAGAVLFCRLTSSKPSNLFSLFICGSLAFLIHQSHYFEVPLEETLTTAANIFLPSGWVIGLFYKEWTLLPLIGLVLWLGSAPWIYHNLKANFHPDLEPPLPPPKPPPVEEAAPGWLERRFARWLSPREWLIWRHFFCTYPQHWSRTYRNTVLAFLCIPPLIAGVDALEPAMGLPIGASILVLTPFLVYFPNLRESRPGDLFHLLPVGVRELRVVFAKEVLARNIAIFPLLLLATAYLFWHGGLPFSPMPAVMASIFLYAIRPLISLYQTLRGVRPPALVLGLMMGLMAAITLIGLTYTFHYGGKGQWLAALAVCGAMGGILWVQEHFLLRRYERCRFDLMR